MAIRFGVAGTAHWASNVHVPGLLATPDVKLVGVWGRNAAKAREIAGRHAIRAFATYEEMLEHVDAVSIAVPPAVQGPLAEGAARAGKHLLLEKPLSTSVEGAGSVVEAIGGRVASVVFFMRRFVPEIEHAVHAVAGQSWESAEIRVLSSAMATVGPYSDSVWRRAAGAALWDNAPHVLSILIPALGPVTKVSAAHNADRVTHMTTHHARGAVANAKLTLHASPDAARREYTFISPARRLTLPDPDFSHQGAYSRAAHDLVTMIASGTYVHRCSAGFGLDVVRILEAADRSAALGKAVDVQDPAAAI